MRLDPALEAMMQEGMTDESFQPAGPLDQAQLAAEEAKRDRVWDRDERLRVIFETINWAESQSGVSRNTKESCLRRQREILERRGRVHPVDPSPLPEPDSHH